MTNKLKIEVSAPNIEQLEALMELMRDLLDDFRKLGGDRKTADKYIERFIKIMGFE